MNNVDLKQVWLNSLPSAINDAEDEWNNIVSKYSGTGRHYHTMEHLQNMYKELQEYYVDMLPVATVLALMYHDFEYSALRSDNEKQSAVHSEKKLGEWNLPQELVQKVSLLIISTQSHRTDGGDEELKVFLDADMAVLGYDAATYAGYIAAVRKEFSIYPDFIYNKGRRDFVKKTLEGSRIFLTEYFFEKYEQQARINLQNELNTLL